MKLLKLYRTVTCIPTLRRRAVCWSGLYVLALAAMACTGTQAPAVQAPVSAVAKPAPRVILVTVDGLMPSTYLEPDLHGLSVPTLRAMRQGGAYSPGVRTVFPSVTFPAHTTMVTGVAPNVHGIVSNKTLDPLSRNKEGWYWYSEDIRVPTLWQIAEQAGMCTALVSWPVTVGARADAVVPEFWRAGTPDDAKLSKALSTPGLLDAVAERFPDFWQGFTPPDVADKALIDIAIHLIETAPPQLMLVHTWMVDEFQHRNGPWSDEAKEKIEEADRQLARLIEALQRAGIWEETILVVLSDHGFMPVHTHLAPGVILAQLGLVTLEGNTLTSAKAFVDANGGQAYIHVTDESDQATKDLLMRRFTEMASQPDSGIDLVWTRDEIRARGGDERAFLALNAAPGFALRAGYTGELETTGLRRGTHGYDETLPEMNASLLIYGPRVAPGVIENARLIDIAPTIAQWLSLPMTNVQGKPLAVPMAQK